MRLPSSATKHSNHRSCPKPLSDNREASEPGSGSPTWAASPRESSAIAAISSNDAWRILNEGSSEWEFSIPSSNFYLRKSIRSVRCNEILDVPGNSIPSSITLTPVTEIDIAGAACHFRLPEFRCGFAALPRPRRPRLRPPSEGCGAGSSRPKP